MTGPGHEQSRFRDQMEAAIGLASPFLDLLLGVGERISRIAEPVDYEHYPVRAEDGEGEPAAGARAPERPDRG